MTDRERFLETMRFGTPDRIPYWEFGVFGHTLERWRKEGLPANASLDDYFGFDKRERIAVNFQMWPEFEQSVLAETDEFQIVIEQFGIKQRRWKDGRIGMPEFLEHPIKTRAEFQKMKRRYDPDSPQRYPQPWDASVKRCNERDYPLYAQAFRHIGFFGPIRNWMGLEALLFAFYDEPLWVHEMMEFVGDFLVAMAERIGPHISLDYLVFFEDIGFKGSTLISPQIFRTFMMQHYRRGADAFRKYGTEVFFADSDGWNDNLIPLWMECGVNGFSPMEVAAGGKGPVALRQEYGRDLLLYGGMDKRVLAQDKKAVEKEVLGKLPYMVEKGGYIPTIDHSIPHDASFVNYVYYRQLIRDVAEGKCGG